MYSEVYSTTIYGLSVHIVTVEVDVTNGLPAFEMSGYLTGEVKESKERIKVAIRNSGIELRPQKIIINVSPADLRKTGTGFDLPIAVGVLLSNGIIQPDSVADTVIIGELSLDGTVNPVNGILSSICEAKKVGFLRCIIPYDNLNEALLVDNIEIIAVSSLKQLIDILNKAKDYDVLIKKHTSLPQASQKLDFSDICGQTTAKRATLIAVAGMHNIMYVGSPGCGKTMLAKRIPTIMPKLTYEESLELTKIYSIAGIVDRNKVLVDERPFRSPNHNVTSCALLGGGTVPRPGEITLAGKGVLFLDEMTEYKSGIIETLRQPLEEKKITVSRLNYMVTFPSDFMLAAAINPCKCGFYPNRNICKCSDSDIQRFLGRISMPIWDRFDITIRVPSTTFNEMTTAIYKDNTKINKSSAEAEADEYSSYAMKCKVEQARLIQMDRFKNHNISFNSEMSPTDIKEFCRLDEQGLELMSRIFNKLRLSARGYHKILKNARTIADIDGEKNISIKHLSEAVSYKSIFTSQM